jgi:SpoVK/Ycf46/Vps4 family AAA+-type ATPase
MKGELLKRFFRAIASSDQEAIDKLTYLVIEEERSKGHTLLADQLENITKKKPKDQSPDFIKPVPSVTNATQTTRENLQGLSELPTSKRFNLPLVTTIPRDKLRHYMVLPENIEKRFQRIEREYAARDRLAHHGLRYRQKILLYGPPGCGKTCHVNAIANYDKRHIIEIPMSRIKTNKELENIINLTQINEVTFKKEEVSKG